MLKPRDLAYGRLAILATVCGFGASAVFGEVLTARFNLLKWETPAMESKRHAMKLQELDKIWAAPENDADEGEDDDE